MFDPYKVETYTDYGSANMGDAADEENIRAQFGLDDSRWALSYIRCHFAGPGTGVADLAIVLDSRFGETYNTVLFTMTDVGINTDVFFRVPADELPHWVFEPGERLVLEWTNPDTSDDVQWGLEVGMLRDE